jgi:hypothetical protein
MPQLRGNEPTLGLNKKHTKESRMFVVKPTWDSFMDGTILPRWKLLRPVHEMNHTTLREGPNMDRIHKYLPYLVHQDGYQRL